MRSFIYAYLFSFYFCDGVNGDVMLWEDAVTVHRPAGGYISCKHSQFSSIFILLSLFPSCKHRLSQNRERSQIYSASSWTARSYRVCVCVLCACVLLWLSPLLCLLPSSPPPLSYRHHLSLSIRDGERMFMVSGGNHLSLPTKSPSISPFCICFSLLVLCITTGFTEDSFVSAGSTQPCSPVDTNMLCVEFRPWRRPSLVVSEHVPRLARNDAGLSASKPCRLKKHHNPNHALKVSLRWVKSHPSLLAETVWWVCVITG